MRVIDIISGILIVGSVFLMAMILPTLVWSATTLNRYNDYPFHVKDINNINNDGEFLHEGIMKQSSLLVKKFTTDSDGNIILTDYAYQDGSKYIEVMDIPLVIPILKADLGQR